MTLKENRNFLVSACMLIFTFFCCNFASGQSIVKQGPAVPVNFCIGTNEMELYLLINEYRKNFNLPPIPLSKSLSHIAALHAKDLYLNHPNQGSCNFHSWSNKGFWIPFCYPKDETKKNSVWDKPRELTKYPSRAYEIVYWENNPLIKDTIIMVWKTEDYFNSFLLNTGKWQGKTWNAIGIAVFENYACAWFGESSDPEGEVFVCGSKPEEHLKDSIKPRVNQVNSRLSKDSIPAIYCIIVKTNLSPDAAKKMVTFLKSNEYPDAKVLEKDGKLRVSAFESPDKSIVMAKLKAIKKTYKDAWLLKR